MSYLPVSGGNDIYFETHGTGVPVLFLNGLLGNPAIWKKYLVDHLTEDFMCILLSFRGQDLTKINGEFSFEDILGDIKRLVDYLALPKINIVGDAVGARFALALASEHPQLVNKIVLSSGASLKDHILRLSLKSWYSVLQNSDLDTLYQVILPNLFSNDFFANKPESLEEIKQTIMSQKKREHLLALMKNLFNAQSAIDITRIKTPTLVIQGAKDRCIPRVHGIHLADILPNAVYTEVDSGHVIFVEKPNEYAEAIRNFLLE